MTDLFEFDVVFHSHSNVRTEALGLAIVPSVDGSRRTWDGGIVLLFGGGPGFCTNDWVRVMFFPCRFYSFNLPHVDMAFIYLPGLGGLAEAVSAPSQGQGFVPWPFRLSDSWTVSVLFWLAASLAVWEGAGNTRIVKIAGSVGYAVSFSGV